MKYTDIAIIGGGLAGSIAAAMLGRAGIAAVMIDPHVAYPSDFRVEKISGGEQIDRFRKTGLAESVLRSATHDGENWIARFGYLLDRRPSGQFGMMYDSLVNAVRAEIPPAVERCCAKVVAVAPSAERQRLTLSDGEAISARLVVLANGLNVGLRRSLGIERRIVSPCHSISIGFDVAPVGRPAFDFPALTYFSERPSDRIPYLSLFPIETGCGPICSFIARPTIPGSGNFATRRSRPWRPRYPGCTGSSARSTCAAISRSGPPISMSAPIIASPASFWSATPSRPPAR